MDDLRQRFEQAAKDAKSLASPPDNQTLLRLYALYKQGTLGDVSAPRPGAYDFIGTAKHEAWERLLGMPQDEAMRKYIEIVAKLRG